MADDLHSLKDDMIAFITGHGLQRFHAYVPEEMNSVVWESGSNPDAWKDFVEVAKGSGLTFVTYSDDTLTKEDLEFLIERLESTAALDEEMDDARFLKAHVGKVGFIQLGFSYQGTMFLYEVSASWYDRYQQLLDSSEDFGTILLDERDEKDDDKF
jgi:hypothetical protein